MILEMEHFNFDQNQSNLFKSNHFCQNFALKFAQISPQSNQICPNLINFA